MKLYQLDYDFPKKLVAHSPADPRDSSKLLVLNKDTGKIAYHIFNNLPAFLTENDVLVFNQTKVFPARLLGKKKTGGSVEILLLQQLSSNTWTGIHKGKVVEGQTLDFNNLLGKIIEISGKSVQIEFNCKGSVFWNLLEKTGSTPIPPYINSTIPEAELRKKYQTVYAKNIGSAAAPTAGFHFTKSLLDKLKQKGVQMEYVTLHVGLGTFTPLKEKSVEDHKIHEEHFDISPTTVKRLNKAKRKGKRIIAVGTTTTRVLETLSDDRGKLTNPSVPITNHRSQKTKLFIYPPYKFNFIDALITNFHLPKSTLLALVSAFVSYPNTKEKFTSFKESMIGKAYLEAIKNSYKFYSFGDAMLID